jgi:membrane-associated protease RseP (regulator of RpoE activity)
MRSKLFVVLFAAAILAVAGAWVLHQTVLAQDQQKEAKETKTTLGVYAVDISENTAERLDLPGTDGAYITGVSWGGAAAEAGLRRGDVITAVDNKAIKSADNLAEIIKSYKPGDKVTVSFIREGERQTLVVTLKEGKSLRFHVREPLIARPDMEKYFTVRPKIAALLERPWIGINYSELNEQLGSYFGVENGKGVLVTEVLKDSPAAKAGLMAGDVIVSLDGKQIENGSELRSAIWKFEGEEGAAMDVTVTRKGQSMTLKVVPEKNRKGSWDVYVPRIQEELAPLMEGLSVDLGAMEMSLGDLGDFDFHMPKIDIDISELEAPIAPEMEGLACEMDALGMALDELYDVDIHIPEIVIDIPGIMAPPVGIYLNDFGRDLRFRLKIDHDGKVIFNDKEFESIDKFKEFLKSDEYQSMQKEIGEKIRKKIEEKLEKVKVLKGERVVI